MLAMHRAASCLTLLNAKPGAIKEIRADTIVESERNGKYFTDKKDEEGKKQLGDEALTLYNTEADELVRIRLDFAQLCKNTSDG